MLGLLATCVWVENPIHSFQKVFWIFLYHVGFHWKEIKRINSLPIGLIFTNFWKSACLRVKLSNALRTISHILRTKIATSYLSIYLCNRSHFKYKGKEMIFKCKCPELAETINCLRRQYWIANRRENYKLIGNLPYGNGFLVLPYSNQMGLLFYICWKKH